MKRNIIALTGGIGSGKSTVSRILKEFGYTVIDSDDISRKVATEETVLNEVSALLGKGYVENGVLNRGKVREIIFKDKSLYVRYSNLFWKRIENELREIIDNINAQTVFVEIAVVGAFDFPWTEIWLVETDSAIRIGRVSSRDGVGEDDVKRIMASQNNVSEFTRKITNNGDIENLKVAVSKILDESKLQI